MVQEGQLHYTCIRSRVITYFLNSSNSIQGAMQVSDSQWQYRQMYYSMLAHAQAVGDHLHAGFNKLHPWSNA